MAALSIPPIPQASNWSWGGFQGQSSGSGVQASGGGYGNTGSLPTNLPAASDPYGVAAPTGANIYTTPGGVNVQDYSGVNAGGPSRASVTAYLDPNNRQGYGDAQFLNNLGTSFAQSTGRLPSAQDQLYYEKMYQGGADPSEIFANIGKSQEAQTFGASGQPNPYAGYVAAQGALPTASAGGASAPAATAQQASYGFSSNPFMRQQSDAMRAQQAQLFGDMNNQITSQAVGAGGLGGSRQGVAQGVAQARAATGLDSALAGMYGNAYEGDQNRALSQYQGDQQFYGQQRGQDLQQAGLGATLYGMGTTGEWSPYSNYSGVLSPYSGFGTTTGTSNSGAGALGFLGGALGGAQLANTWSNPSSTSPSSSNSFKWW